MPLFWFVDLPKHGLLLTFSNALLFYLQVKLTNGRLVLAIWLFLFLIAKVTLRTEKWHTTARYFGAWTPKRRKAVVYADDSLNFNNSSAFPTQTFQNDHKKLICHVWLWTTQKCPVFLREVRSTKFLKSYFWFKEILWKRFDDFAHCQVLILEKAMALVGLKF